MPLEIVVDAMGSDHAPESEIRGSIVACRKLDVRIVLAGPEDRLRPALDAALRDLNAEHLPIEVLHAPQWISMEDKAASVIRSKPNSSMRLGLKRVREGTAAGFFTAGNTGAAMATAKMVLGMLPGVDRPALAAVLPTTAGPCLLLDVGANVDSDPENLVQFALMGNIYARQVMAVAHPRVGLLSIGEEDSKGNAQTRETLPLLREEPLLQCIGNVEGRDLFNGHADVIVCDGFVGNVALKASEGLARLVRDSLKESLRSTVSSTIGALLSQSAFRNWKRRLDYTEYGGAPLLGVRGACIIGHGSSNDTAVLNGIRVTAEFAQARVNDAIAADIQTRRTHLAHPTASQI